MSKSSGGFLRKKTLYIRFLLLLIFVVAGCKSRPSSTLKSDNAPAQSGKFTLKLGHNNFEYSSRDPIDLGLTDPDSAVADAISQIGTNATLWKYMAPTSCAAGYFTSKLLPVDVVEIEIAPIIGATGSCFCKIKSQTDTCSDSFKAGCTGVPPNNGPSNANSMSTSGERSVASDPSQTNGDAGAQQGGSLALLSADGSIVETDAVCAEHFGKHYKFISTDFGAACGHESITDGGTQVKFAEKCKEAGGSLVETVFCRCQNKAYLDPFTEKCS